MMKLTVIGCGYLGAVHAACMAQLGHDVVGIDVDEPKVKLLASGKTPFFEPGFEEVLQAALASGRLSFTSDMASAKGRQVHFVCVGTPQKRNEYAADMAYVDAAVTALAAVPVTRRPGGRQVHGPGRHGTPTCRLGHRSRNPARCLPGTRSSSVRGSPSRTPCTRIVSSTGCRPARTASGPRPCSTRCTQRHWRTVSRWW